MSKFLFDTKFASVTHFERERGRDRDRQTKKGRGREMKKGRGRKGERSILLCKAVVLVFGYPQKLVLLLR